MLPRTTTFSRIWNLSPATMDELRREFDNAVGSVSGAVSRTCSGHPPISVWESEQKLVIEIDGLIHQLPDVHENDIARESWLKEQGFEVIRFTNESILPSYILGAVIA